MSNQPSLAALIAGAKKQAAKKGAKPKRLKLIGDELLSAAKRNDGEAFARGVRNLMRISDEDEEN